MRKPIHTATQERFLALLKGARKAAGLTQAQVAGRLKKPQSFVTKYENGERRLDVLEFLSVAGGSGYRVRGDGRHSSRSWRE